MCIFSVLLHTSPARLGYQRKLGLLFSEMKLLLMDITHKIATEFQQWEDLTSSRNKSKYIPADYTKKDKGFDDIIGWIRSRERDHINDRWHILTIVTLFLNRRLIPTSRRYSIHSVLSPINPANAPPPRTYFMFYARSLQYLSNEPLRQFVLMHFIWAYVN